MADTLFRVRTVEGGQYLIRFDPQIEADGDAVGRLHLVGYSPVAGAPVEVVGMGACPEPGGRIVVSATPTEWAEFGEESYPRYPTEEILTTTPVQLPERLLARLRA